MSSASHNCSCQCAPCSCAAPTGFGCLSDMCVPRPCFFDGQLITADDMNATVAYFRAREAMLSRLAVGWGVLGGLRVDAAPTTSATPLLETPSPLTPNPQIIAGTNVQVQAGVAIDARGRALVLCGPRILDLAKLMEEAPTTPKVKTCAKWLPSYVLSDDPSRANVSALSYWLVAEYVERPSRPVPRYAGGGACDPAPDCDFSRAIEDVRFRLVPSLPSTYFATGCLELHSGLLQPDVMLPDPETFDPEEEDSGGGGGGSEEDTLSSNPLIRGLTKMDFINGYLSRLCCERPVVVLARILITAAPGGAWPSTPTTSLYTIVADGYPFRRVAVTNNLAYPVFGTD